MHRKNKSRLHENKFKHALDKESHRKHAKEVKRINTMEKILFAKVPESVPDLRGEKSNNDKCFPINKSSSIDRYSPQRHENFHISVRQLNRVSITGLFLLLLLGLANANLASKNHYEELPHPSDLPMQDKTTLLGVSDTQTFFSSSKKFGDNIITKFRQRVREGNLDVMNYILEDYTQHTKRLIASVTVSDLAILKKADELGAWEDSGIGPCRDDDENHFYVYADSGLCQRVSRVPPQGAYERITNFLHANLIDEQEKLDGSKLKRRRP